MPSACVTGATGYVASELIRQLLSRGYSIKATVRCAPDSQRLQYLRDLASSSSSNLELVQVPDLQQHSEALDAAIAGTQYLFHVASPFRFDGDPNNDIVQPAVQGTRTVLEAAAKHKPRLQRVVVTSSVCGKQSHLLDTPTFLACKSATRLCMRLTFQLPHPYKPCIKGCLCQRSKTVAYSKLVNSAAVLLQSRAAIAHAHRLTTT